MTEIDIGRFTEIQARRLQKFLAAPEQPEDTMSYFELAGFLFAVCSSPEPVNPSEWLPLIFDEQEAVYRNMEEAKEILGAIMNLYNLINEGVIERRPELPPGLAVRKKPIDNLAPEAHVSQWAKGFMNGHAWLQEIWDDYTPAELDGELGAVLFVLFFFADRKLAAGFRREMLSNVSTLEEAAGVVLPLLEDSMQSYAHLGRSISEALIETSLYDDEQKMEKTANPGRNDPCPCGSGKKYKKCCGGVDERPRNASAGKVYQLKVTLKGSKPPIWRRILVPDATLDNIANYLITAIGWIGGHLHGFSAGNAYYGISDPEWGDPNMIDESTVMLSQIISSRRKKFTFDYDFGDGWEHEVLVEKVLEPEPGVTYPVCLTGRRACPPEDVGGIYGFYEFLEVMDDPDHPEHEEMMEWIGGPFNPAAFDLKETNAALIDVAGNGGWREEV